MAGDHPIDCRDLYKSYGDVHALNGLSFEVEAGRVLALLGSNGSGKTTTVRVLTAQIPLDSGTACVAGHDVSRDPLAVRTLIGVTNQETHIDGFLTGAEYMDLVARLRHLSRDRRRGEVPALLEELGLADEAGARVRTYSGGMRRRLDLAAGLLGSPPVVFLDEPSNGLDPHNRQLLWDAIRSRAREGTTVLLTTQYMEEADALADSIVLLARGKMIASGAPSDLKDTIEGRIVELVVDDSAHAAELLGRMGIAVHSAFGPVTFALLPTDPTLLSILRQLEDVGVSVNDVIARRPTLDEAFLHLVAQAEERQPTIAGER